MTRIDGPGSGSGDEFGASAQAFRLLVYFERDADGTDWMGMREPENHRTFLATDAPVEIQE